MILVILKIHINFIFNKWGISSGIFLYSLSRTLATDRPPILKQALSVSLHLLPASVQD